MARLSALLREGLRTNPDVLLVPLLVVMLYVSIGTGSVYCGHKAAEWVQNTKPLEKLITHLEYITEPDLIADSVGLLDLLGFAAQREVDRVIDFGEELYLEATARLHTRPRNAVLLWWNNVKSRIADWLGIRVRVSLQKTVTDYGAEMLAGIIPPTWIEVLGGMHRYAATYDHVIACMVWLLCVYLGMRITNALFHLYTRSELGQRAGNYIMSHFSPRWTYDENSTIRSSFNLSFRWRQSHVVPGHNHGLAASYRTGASFSIQSWIRSLGLRPYIVSGCGRDNEEDVGFHGAYMDKDFLMPSKHEVVESDHIIVMVDVDYYVDMPSWINTMRPLVLYTSVPRQVAGATLDGSFTIIDDQLVVTANGDGASSYHHRLWDYGYDYIVVRNWFSSTICSVQRKRLPPPEDEAASGGPDDICDREVILIVPQVVVPFPFNRWDLGPILQRRTFEAVPGINLNTYLAPTARKGQMQPRVSIGRAGQLFAVDLSAEALHAIIVRCQTAGKPEISSVERALGVLNNDDTAEAARTAPQLFSIVSEVVERAAGSADVERKCWRPSAWPLLPSATGPGGWSSRSDLVRAPTADHYQSVGSPANGFLTWEDGRDIARVAGQPIVSEPDVAPSSSYNNQRSCVTGRITNVANYRTPSDPKVDQWGLEFKRLLLGSDAGALTPLSLEEVKEIQTEPAQKLRAEREFGWDSPAAAASCRGSCFVKRETYGAVNDPRNITQTPTAHMQEMSGYTYAFKRAILKTKRWYTPGMSPRRIAERLREFCAGPAANGATETDYSRFDGTISAWLHGFVTGIYIAAFRPCYRNNIERLWKAELDPTCKTRGGVRFRGAGSRLSGSPLTTDGNTIINAFVSFVALRFEGYSATEAMDRLGLYCGDDGVMSVSEVSIGWAAEQFGLKIKCIDRPRYGSVGYLGRVFLDPWTRSDSIQDPVRTAKKIHLVTANDSVPLSVAATWRATGYLQLDPHAPLNAAYARALLRTHQAASDEWVKGCETDERRRIICEREQPTQVPFWLSTNDSPEESWPTPGPNDDLALLVVAKAFGVDPAEIKKAEEALDTSDNILTADLPKLPTSVEVKIDAVVSGRDHLSRPGGQGKTPTPQPPPEDVAAGYSQALDTILEMPGGQQPTLSGKPVTVREALQFVDHRVSDAAKAQLSRLKPAAKPPRQPKPGTHASQRTGAWRAARGGTRVVTRK